MGCAGLCLCPGPEIWIGPWDIPTFPLPPTRKLMQRQKAAQCARQRVGPKSTFSILTHQVNTDEVTNHPYLVNLKLTKLLTHNHTHTLPLLSLHSAWVLRGWVQARTTNSLFPSWCVNLMALTPMAISQRHFTPLVGTHNGNSLIMTQWRSTQLTPMALSIRVRWSFTH